MHCIHSNTECLNILAVMMISDWLWVYQTSVPNSLTPGLTVTTEVSHNVRRNDECRQRLEQSAASGPTTLPAVPSARCLLAIMADDGLDSINWIVRGWDLMRFLINGLAPAAPARYRIVSSDVCVCIVMTRLGTWTNAFWLNNDCAHLVIGCYVHSAFTG